MAGKKNPKADTTNPETFDVDGWIDGIVRPEMTVELDPAVVEYDRQVQDIDQRIAVAEKNPDRGIGDDSPEALYALKGELARERAERSLPVRVRQITKSEMFEALHAAKAAGADPDDYWWWNLAAACVEPAFTPMQLKRLSNRDLSGELMVAQLTAAVNSLLGLPTPS